MNTAIPHQDSNALSSVQEIGDKSRLANASIVTIIGAKLRSLFDEGHGPLPEPFTILMKRIGGRNMRRSYAIAAVPNKFRDELLAAMPMLRAYAISLTRDRSRADDLVQNTLVKAWANHGRFLLGSNMRAWLSTILRNEFYSLMRKKGREVADVDGMFTENIGIAPDQLKCLDLADMHAALGRLELNQREALLLTAASGFSYEEVAQICNVAVGTIKSRVNRGRTKLAEILGIVAATEFGSDAGTAAALALHAHVLPD